MIILLLTEGRIRVDEVEVRLVFVQSDVAIYLAESDLPVSTAGHRSNHRAVLPFVMHLLELLPERILECHILILHQDHPRPRVTRPHCTILHHDSRVVA